MSYERNRGSVFLEDARILAQRAWPGQQFVLRVQAPRAARKAAPGTFAHIACDPSVPMRRPLSIMRASAAEGWLEFLYKPKGHGLEHARARANRARVLSVLAPIGHGFTVDPARPRLLALGGGVGIPPMIFLADQVRADARLAAARADGLRSAVPVRARGVAARRSRRRRKRRRMRSRCSSSGACRRGSRATPGSRALIAATSRISRATRCER